MFSKVNSGGLCGIEGYLVEVEADASEGLPCFQMVGYLASEVKEAEERVRTALRNAGFPLPAMKITLNLSPADVRKEGTGFDLPIAVAVLAAYGELSLKPWEQTAWIGELGLDGRIKPVRGVLPMVLGLQKQGIRRCFLPEENLAEGLVVQNMKVYAVRDLKQMVGWIREPEKAQVAVCENFPDWNIPMTYPVDFREVGGQLLMRRATEIAVAGQHNLLYIGPPGSGKSMVAKRVPTIMPSMSREEQLEISKVYSVCGMLPPGKALAGIRPFRAPHHTISQQALIGGGRIPKPGEISLATRGVLFLDELPEFQKGTLEVLRQPMEEHQVTVSRAYGTFRFPANFMIVAAMNPCKCGYYPDRSRCSCTSQQVQKYLSRISGPLLDRIDLCVEAAPVTYGELRGGGASEPSSAIRERVEAARKIQKKRFAGRGIYANGEMKNSEIQAFCGLGEKEEEFLQTAFRKMQLTARGCNKVLKVARTIADLEGTDEIQCRHLAEAFGYREPGAKYWGRDR